MTLKKKIKNIGTILWLCAALLATHQQSIGAEPSLSPLYKNYEGFSIEQLLGVYNSAVGYHDNLRAQITKTLREPELTRFIDSDDWWCSNRQKEFENAVATKNHQAIVELIVLENLRNGILLEKIP